MSVSIIQATALDLPLRDSSVDLAVTSPPYYGQRSYQDDGEHYQGQLGDEETPVEFVESLVAATREMVRVLKPSGSIFVNLGDKYASSGGHGISATPSVRLNPTGRRGEHQRAGIAARSGRPERNTSGIQTKSLMGIPWRYALRCIDELGLILRAEVIWSKRGGMPESVTDRVRRSHETWFHFTRGPRYFCTDEATDQRSSVWEVAPQPLQVPAHLPQHFAPFPLEFPLRIIRGWCPEGGTVLDPFGGTGTTALAARALGRNAVTADLSRDYCRLARWRCSDPGELARAMGVDRPPPAPVGVDSLLDLLEEGAA